MNDSYTGCLTCCQPVRIHVGATTERLLIAAELMELKKPYEDNSLREVALDDLHNFKNTGELFGPGL